MFKQALTAITITAALATATAGIASAHTPTHPHPVIITSAPIHAAEPISQTVTWNQFEHDLILAGGIAALPGAFVGSIIGTAVAGVPACVATLLVGCAPGAIPAMFAGSIVGGLAGALITGGPAAGVVVATEHPQ